MKIVFLLFRRDANRPSAVAFSPNGMKKNMTKMIRKGTLVYCTGTKAAQVRRLRDDFTGSDPIKDVNKRLRSKWVIESYLEDIVRR